MRHHRSHRSGRLIVRAVPALVAAFLIAACGGGGGAASDAPEGVVRTALDRMAAMDVEGLSELACAGQGEQIREQLGLPGGIGGELLEGLDTQELLDAVKLDVADVQVGSATVDGDVAQVPVEGDLGVTFDAEAMRPILRELLGAQGQSMTDDELDALLAGLEAFGQTVPLETDVRLVREDGAWKVCQEAITP
jgi:hypothetical protein